MTAPVPSTSQTILANGLPSLPEDTTADSAIIGVCTLGTPNTIYTYRGPQSQQAITDLGTGPLVDRVVYQLASGKTVHAVPGTVTAGSWTAVTASGGGPAVTLTGTPGDYYQLIVEIMLGGAVATATFRYSLDGGDTYSDTIVTAATYLMPGTGTTLNFAAGTYVIDETYSATGTAPTITSTNIGVAMDALQASTVSFGMVGVAGQAADAAATLVISTLLQSKCDTGAAAQKYYFAIQESPAVDKALMIAAYAAFAGDRVSLCGGFCELVSPISSRVQKRSIAWWYQRNLCAVPISVDPKRNAADDNLGPAVGITVLVPQGSAASTGYHDEGKTPGYNAARFTSMMTFPNVAGFFITNGKMMATAGTDFDLVQYRRVMDRACTINAAAMPAFLGKRTATDSDGFILEEDASAIEKAINDLLNQGLIQTGHAQSVSVVITRNNVIATTGLIDRVRLKPWSYPMTFSSEIGFSVAA